jgi:hypothetical protein
VLVPMIQMIVSLLSEIQPRFIIMFELNRDFVRPIKVGNSIFWARRMGADYTCSLGLSKLEYRPWGEGILHGLST